MLGTAIMHEPPGQRKAPQPSERAPYLLVALVALLSAAIGGVAWKFHLQQVAAFQSEVNSRLLTIAMHAASLSSSMSVRALWTTPNASTWR